MSRKQKTKKPERLVKIIGEEAVVQVKPAPNPKKIRLSFDAWWSLLRTKKQLPETLKEIIKKHFEQRGFLESQKFDEGLIDFGIKT